MALDLSKLQAIDTTLAADVQALVTTIQTEAATLQAAINALSTSDSGDQTAIDAVVADLTTVSNNLTAATTSVQGLPTAPTT